MTPRFFIAFSGGDDALLSACAEVLEQVAHVRSVDPLDLSTPDAAGKDLAAASLLLLVLREPIADGVARMVRLRLSQRRLPLLLLAFGVTPDQAVELVKCGAADLLSLRGSPPSFIVDAPALHAKVERALWRRNGLTLEDPVLAPLAGLYGPAAAAYASSNRRLCYRANTSNKASATLVLPTPPGEARCQISDISVATEEQSGGLRLRAEPMVAAKMPLSTWHRGSELSGALLLTDENTSIPLRLRIIRAEGGTGGQAAQVALQYIPLDPRHEQRIQRFWMRCQQR